MPVLKQIINGDEYHFSNDIREDETHLDGFFRLSKNTFKLDLSSWHEGGYWKEDYIPHVLLKDERVVSNVSLNVIRFRHDGRIRRYVQVGTVMTDPEFRGRGLSRWLIEYVIEEWKNQCDAIYLYANDRVLDFYPRFGFVKTFEYQYSKSIAKKSGNIRRLDMSLDEDRKILMDHYRLSNPFSTFTMEDNPGLLMFYCTGFLKDNIFLLEQEDAVAIVEYNADRMLCYDLFCQPENSLDDMLGILAKEVDTTAILGFAPMVTEGFNVVKISEKDTTFFMLSGMENLFVHAKMMLPLLSRA